MNKEPTHSFIGAANTDKTILFKVKNTLVSLCMLKYTGISNRLNQLIWLRNILFLPDFYIPKMDINMLM